MITENSSFRLMKIACTIALAFACAAVSRAGPIISELMAANTKVHADEDGAFSDWIELHNPDDTAVELEGWYLTDSASNKTKWKLPAVTLPPGGYLIIFASNKDRINPAAPLHTNFALSAGGEYLGLIRPDGSTVESEFAPGFPEQSDNISYGRVALADGGYESGFLRVATPGAANGGTDALLLLETIATSPASAVFSESITVELSGAGPGQEIRYVAATGPDAVAVELTAESPVYEGPLTFSSTTLLRAAVFSADGGIRGATTTAHYLKSTGELAGFTSKLPILILDDLGAGQLVKDGEDHLSWFYGYTASTDNSGLGERSPDFATPLLATVRGSSSADFAKKGYNLKVRDALGNKRTLPIFGLPAYDRWALIAPWAFDMNYINNSFIYELSNRIGRWAPRTRLAEMFFNTGGDDLDAGDYVGIYVVADRIRAEKGRVDIHELSPGDVNAPAITGGYILKINEMDADEIGWHTEKGVPPPEADESIVLVAPDAGDIGPAQLEYIQGYVQQMENALHADRATSWTQRTYLDFIDRPAWVDHHILNALANNPDALYRSAYFTKPRGGKLQAGPVWDFDRALGGYWDERTNLVDTWSGINGHVDIWKFGWWGVLAEDPDFVQAWIDRWQQLRTAQLSTDALTSLAQTLADSVGTAAANRDAERWPDTAPPSGSYEAQIDSLKDWLTRRTAWIDAQFVARPTFDNNGGMLTFTAPEGARLAYTLDGTDPRMGGGALAPNAVVSSEPLSVPASADVHVRSYNPAMAGGVPGSAWSSLVSGPASSPLVPTPRVVNLSGRAIAGSGADALIIGVEVADTISKRYLARGIGPGLASFGASDTIGAPQVRITDSAGVELGRNLGWQNASNPGELQEMAKTVGAFQLADGSADSALIAELSAGQYSVEIATTNSQPGVALGELYELDTNGRTAKLSLQGRVSPGQALIAGFVVQGPARKRLLIRAVGPTLAERGIGGALPDPLFTIHSSTGVVAANDRWGDDENAAKLETAEPRVAGFPLSNESEDAATVVTLASGAYTVEVKGKEDAAGIVLLEIYDLR